MTDAIDPPKETLDPFDRMTEVVSGVIMVITFTGSLSVVHAGRDDVRALLVGVIGCNAAWGIVDAIIYLMGRLSENGQNLKTHRAVLTADNPAAARQLISDALPPAMAAVIGPDELENMRVRLKELPEPPSRPTLSKDDWVGALVIFFLVLFVTFPLVIPFLLVQDAKTAVRLSHSIAIVTMFAAGHRYGHLEGVNPLRTGFVMVLIGAVLAAVTIVLGG